MLTNREVFVKDPLKTTIPNNGVAKVVEPQSQQEWDVLRYELQSFVCEGEYRNGLERILSSFLRNLGEPVQPAVWVSGFYGCGKSHLARVLEFLWRNVTFPDGASARGLVSLPGDITAHLTELQVVGRREGGLWSAAGTLAAGAGDSVRLAFLGTLFRSAGLPSQYAPARFCLWLRQNGWYEDVKGVVEATGKDFGSELLNMYVSPVLARALLDCHPDFAGSERAARELLKAQFPMAADINDDEMVRVLGEVLMLSSTTPGKIPCTLIVLDELQQYLGGSAEKTLQVQNLVEACSSRFESRILFVATGQAALQGSPQLSKLQGRFTVQVALSDRDVERVVREVVLRKLPDRTASVKDVLDSCSGEIDRHLSGTKIGPIPADREIRVADYPLLPVRRRFWERVLRAVDRAGAEGQLRTQLRIVHEATRQVAEEPVGTVVGGDFIYGQLVPSMLQSGVLLPEMEVIVKGQNDGTDDGGLRERLCATIFLISQLPAGPGVETGVRATVETLADLLVQDLGSDGVRLRQRIPGLLAALVDQGALMQVGPEFRLQTRESGEWEGDYRGRYARIFGDEGRIASDRAQELRKACDTALKGMGFTQGESKVPRKIELHFGADEPRSDSGAVPVWIRDEWSVSPNLVREDAQAAGQEGPVVYVFLPKAGTAEALKTAATGLAASIETLQARPTPATREGDEAKNGMQTRQAEHRRQVDALVARVLKDARVFQGGGNEVPGDDLKSMVQSAAEASLSRLYPQFSIGDNPKWSEVGRRVRQGSGDALEALGYTGDSEKHPICVQVLTFTGSAGKKGADIRKKFTGPPYGWQQDAVDGALYVLLASEHLRAVHSGIAVTARSLDTTKIGPAEFRAEGVTLTPVQRIGIRKLFQEAGVPFKPAEESQSVPAYLEVLLSTAQGAGGPPPLPVCPSTGHIDQLKSLVGNDQLDAVYKQRDDLSRQLKEWRTLKQAAVLRLPRWSELKKMLDHAAGLPVHVEIAPQLNAILQNRSLLTDPDPTLPLCSRLADALRTALQDAREHQVAERTRRLPDLTGSDSWQKLDAGNKHTILERQGLQPVPELKVGTDTELLRTLDAASLALWRERANALPQAIAGAMLDAQKRIQPLAVRVELPHETLTTVEDVDAYLNKARKMLLEQIHAGKPVVV